MLTAVAVLAQTTSSDRGGVLTRLTPSTVDEAVACGRSGVECAVNPYALCPDPAGHYSARIATPFSRVASAAFEAQKNGRQGRPMTPAAVNRWGIGIYVFPADKSPQADAIERVEVRSNGKVITPLTSTVGPIAATMIDGSTKQLARGFFTFPPETFSATADVAVVFVGRASGETTCVLDVARLKQLR